MTIKELQQIIIDNFYNAETNEINISGMDFGDKEINISKISAKKITIKEKATPKKTEKEKEIIWINRLSKLTGISTEEAQEIAEEEKEKKENVITFQKEKQIKNPNIERQRLINGLKRINLFTRIKNGEHARNIIKASNRYNSNK